MIATSFKNKIIKTLTYSIFLLAIPFCSAAQASKLPILRTDVKVQSYSTAYYDNDSLCSVFDNIGKHQPYVFAKTILTSITNNNSGVWNNNSDNTKSWIILVKSKDAFSLNINIDSCKFDGNGRFYIYNKNKILMAGPYSLKNCNEDNSLFIQPIPGDELYIEYRTNETTDTSQSLFKISSIGHDFRDFYKNTSTKRGKSGNCEIDINCPTGNDWQLEKRAVVKIVFNGSLGSEACTGTLINNTSNNGLPYILTANHCIKDSKTASSAIFYFEYENTSCGGSASSNYKTMTGANLIATGDPINKLDFSLLCLKKMPPDSFNYYLAGWSLDKQPVKNVVTIHHPKGDVKKISVENDYIQNGSFTDNNYLDNTHWKIAQWDLGVTENGSSGCALFNTNHQIIGDLSGGDAYCGNPYNDYFAKFYKSWDNDPDSANQLKCWLNPLNLAVNECAGFDPLIGDDNPISNISFGENLVSYGFDSKAKGSWTGYNEIGLKQVADKFTGIKNNYIYEIKFPITILGEQTDISKINLHIWNGINNPDSVIYTHALSYDSITQNNYYCIRFAKSQRIHVNSTLFIGFDLSKLQTSDSCYFLTAENRNNKYNTLYYLYQNKWIQAKDLGLYSSLGFELYMTDNITPARQTLKKPEKLLLLSLDTLNQLSTLELFHTDSISNYQETNSLRYHLLTDDKGIWSGTNTYQFNLFAEKIIFNEDKYLSGIKLAIAKNTVKDNAAKADIKVWSGNQKPDSILFTSTMPLTDLKEGYFNVIKFQNKLKIDSVGFIGIQLENISPTDTFAIYMGNNVNTQNRSHSFFYSENEWLNYSMYNIDDVLGISAETVYATTVYDTDSLNYKYAIQNLIVQPDIAYQNIFLYPNPAHNQNTIFIHLGHYFFTSVHLDIYDILGRKIASPTTTTVNGNTFSFTISDFKSGMYYAKVITENQTFKPAAFIIAK